MLEKELLECFQTNVVGTVHLINVFLPLILKGSAKRVIALSTGMADVDLIGKFGVASAAPYAISKAALNAAVAKFSAQYADRGVLFLSISPGLVDTGNYNDCESFFRLFLFLKRFSSLGCAFASANGVPT